DVVPLGGQPAEEVGDVHLRPAAGGQDVFVTEGDLHRSPVRRRLRLCECVLSRKRLTPPAAAPCSRGAAGSSATAPGRRGGATATTPSAADGPRTAARTAAGPGPTRRSHPTSTGA